MNNAKRAAVTAAATAIIATTGIVGAVSASANENCPAGQQSVTFQGQTQCAAVENYPGEVRHGDTHEQVSSNQNVGSASSYVTPSVGVIIRDGNGNLTTSGILPKASFEYLGEKMQGKNGDGVLIKIKQVGSGGWGNLYEGWIPVKYTQIPAMFS